MKIIAAITYKNIERFRGQTVIPVRTTNPISNFFLVGQKRVVRVLLRDKPDASDWLVCVFKRDCKQMGVREEKSGYDLAAHVDRCVAVP